jgi:hypothetical protein
MDDKKIILFSSDATELYKADIFRVLALPIEYTIQFRYERKYVLEKFRDNPAQLINREAVAFFLAGNDLNTPVGERKLKPYPIRQCKIKNAFLDKGTDQIILILKLDQFADCEIDSVTEPSRLPPHIFVGEAKLERLIESSWINRVKVVRDHFNKILFYHIRAILLENIEIKPVYSEARRISIYNLEEESEYSIECSCYDREHGDIPLHIKCQSTDVSLSNTFETGVRAVQDTRRLPLTIRSLTSDSAPAEVIFSSGTSGVDVNRVNLYWRLKRKPWKPWYLALLTTGGAVGLGLSEGVLKDKHGNFESLSDLAIKTAGVILIGLVAAQLFRFFNKTE